MLDTTDRMLSGLDDAQREAVTHPTSPLRIIAGAGAGKTRVLTRRIAYHSAAEAIDPRRVLALTFTRAVPGTSHRCAERHRRSRRERRGQSPSSRAAGCP